jgi:hypothetical protein
VFQKTVLFRFVNVFIPGVRKRGWIVGIVFIDTTAQLLTPTGAAALWFSVVRGHTSRWQHSMYVTSHTTIDKYYIADFCH